MTRRPVRAMGALFRVGLLETLAYRGEMVVWFLTTTMPIIMLALFSAVARDGPMGRYGQAQFAAYFLSTLVVRQLTSSWAVWPINTDVRTGSLSQRLLRPVHPLLAYTAESLAAVPLRAALSVPVAVVLVATVGTRELTSDPVLWALWLASILGGWLLSTAVSFTIGGLAFFTESSLKVLDLWLAFYFVFSGFLIPVDLFPAPVKAILAFLPFRYQIGLSVEIMTGAHDRAHAIALLGGQWCFVLLAAAATALVWRRGLARYAAYGG